MIFLHVKWFFERSVWKVNVPRE